MKRNSSDEQLPVQHPALTTLADVDALFWSGKTREVCRRVERVDLRNADASTAARLGILHGMSLFQLGDVYSANEKLRQSVLLSGEGQTQLHFSAFMSLFGRESQFQAPDESLPALSR